MTKFIEVTDYANLGDTTCLKKVSVNPEYIVAIEEDEGHAIIYLNNKSILHTIESRAEIMTLIKGVNVSTYITG